MPFLNSFHVLVDPSPPGHVHEKFQSSTQLRAIAIVTACHANLNG